MIPSILGSSLSLTSIANLIDFGLIAFVDLHCQSCQFQAHCRHLPPSMIFSILGSSPLATSIANFVNFGLFASFDLLKLLDYPLPLKPHCVHSELSKSAQLPSQAMSYFGELPLSVEATGFTSRDHVEIHVGAIMAKVYPKILPTMVVFKRAHAFQVNKTALTNLQADLHLVFDASSRQLNATSTVDGIYSDWKRHFNENRHTFANLLSSPFTIQQVIRSTTPPWPTIPKSCSLFKTGT
jgi:hypothetical protein